MRPSLPQMCSCASGQAIWTLGQASTRETMPFLGVRVPENTTSQRDLKRLGSAPADSIPLCNTVSTLKRGAKMRIVRSAVYLLHEQQKSALWSDHCSAIRMAGSTRQPISDAK